MARQPFSQNGPDLYVQVCREVGFAIPPHDWADFQSWADFKDFAEGKKTFAQLRRRLKTVIAAKYGDDAHVRHEELNLQTTGAIDLPLARYLSLFRAWALVRDYPIEELRNLLAIPQADETGSIDLQAAINGLLDESIREALKAGVVAGFNGYLQGVGEDVRCVAELPVECVNRVPFSRIGIFDCEGLLMKVRSLAVKFEADAAMSLEEAIGFIVANVIPQYHHHRVTFRRSSYKSRFNRIVMELDPSLGSNDVKKIYSDARTALQAHDRPAKTGTLLLVEHNRNPINSVLLPETRLAEWNRIARENGYTTFENYRLMMKAVDRAEESLLDPESTRKPREDNKTSQKKRNTK